MSMGRGGEVRLSRATLIDRCSRPGNQKRPNNGKKSPKRTTTCKFSDSSLGKDIKSTDLSIGESETLIIKVRAERDGVLVRKGTKVNSNSRLYTR